jgi:hypothetical protein
VLSARVLAFPPLRRGLDLDYTGGTNAVGTGRRVLGYGWPLTDFSWAMSESDLIRPSTKV